MLYNERVLSFDVTFISKIKVESSYRNGVSLNQDHRTAGIKVFSNVIFGVTSENLKESDKGHDLIKYKVNKTDSGEYYLAISVPREITHDFSTHLILTHPNTGSKTVLPVHYVDKSGETH